MELFITIAACIGFGLLCREMAKNRNRNITLWTWLGVLFGVIPVVILLLIGKSNPDS